MYDLTHASFFSGVGGTDLGLEAAGWHTVSFSEIDPYASAVLAERWPGIPNLGDINALANRFRNEWDGRYPGGLAESSVDGEDEWAEDWEWPDRIRDAWRTATLWSGGFPCQDLSVAGKRAGFAGERSVLAFAFLDLVERYRPPAILLENVPGLLSSHRGRDFGTLLHRLAQLRYGWAYRILDARHFGVPQRRRRVFIVALDTERGPGAERAAEVLSVGSRCERHPAAGVEAGPGTAAGTGDGADIVGTIPAGLGHHGQSGTSSQAVNSGHVIASTLKRRDYKSVDDDGARNGHLLVGDSQSIARAIHASTGRRSGPAGDEVSNLVHGVAHAVKPGTGTDGSFERGDADYVLSPSPNSGGVRAPDGLAGRLDSDTVGFSQNQRGELVEHDIAHQLTTGGDDPLLPLGLDSHRYRCCGNGVVSSVSEWIGLRLAALA